MILDKIIQSKRSSLDKAKKNFPLNVLRQELKKEKKLHRNFKESLKNKDPLALIAEIKKASPTLGVLRKRFDPVKIALDYELCGASAISVITEENFFLGKNEYITSVKDAVTLPILRKDFLIDEYQIYESAYLGADAILLIAEILTKEELLKFSSIAGECNLDILAEAHTEEGVDKILDIDFLEIIGINNRDLSTFNIHLGVTERLAKLIPEDKIIISESGIRSYKDVMFLKSLGVDGVLIGEVFMKNTDIQNKIKEIMGGRI